MTFKRHSRSSGMTQFESLICDFLLALHSNYGSTAVSRIVSETQWDIGWNCIVPHLYLAPLLRSEFHSWVYSVKTRMMGLLDDEKVW